MIDNSIDVAKIMREIRYKAIIEKKFEHGIEKGLVDMKSEVSTFSDSIETIKNNIAPYLVMGMRIPQFSSFPFFVRPILVILTRIVRKATLYMTREQTQVNMGLYQLLNDMIKQNEQNQKLLYLIMKLEIENSEIKEKLNQYAELIEQLEDDNNCTDCNQ